MLTHSHIEPVDPNALVVTVEEAKLHCNCDVNTWDSLFPSWIKAATEALQSFTNVAFLPSNVTAVIHQRVFDGRVNYVTLPYANNAVLPVGSGYTLTGDRIYTNNETVSVSYTAGSAPAEWMKQAVKMYVADLFAQRGESDLTDWSANAKIRVGERAKQYCKSFISHGYWF